MAYLVKDDVVPVNAASIAAAIDSSWNSVQINAVGTNTLLSTTGLTSGTYRVYVADEAGNLSAMSTNAVTVDAIAPTVQSVQISSLVSGRDLVAGEQVRVTLQMSEASNVVGAPTYAIDLGGQTKQASYLTGSGSDSLVFAYTISAGDVDLVGGITASANALLADQSQNMVTDIVGNFANASTTAILANANSVRVDAIAPTITNTSSFGVSNLDVMSNIALKFDSPVTALSTGHMSLINDANGNGKNGYFDEANANTIELFFGAGTTANGITTVQTFSDVDRTIASGTLTINDVTGMVTINPLRDLDLSNNYHLVVDADSFQKTSNGLKNAAIGADANLRFSTVTPGSATLSGDISAAASSSIWGADGQIVANGGNSWVSIEGIGTPNGPITIDASTLKPGSTTSDYIFLMHNVSTYSNQSAVAETTGIKFTNFEGGTDILYIDYQGNTTLLPTGTEAIMDGYRAGSGEATGAIVDIAASNNNEGRLSYLQFVGLTEAHVSQSVLFG